MIYRVNKMTFSNGVLYKECVFESNEHGLSQKVCDKYNELYKMLSGPHTEFEIEHIGTTLFDALEITELLDEEIRKSKERLEENEY